MPACQQNQSKMCSCTSTSRDSSVPRSPAFDVERSEFNTRTSSDADARPVIEAPKMKRFSFKFLVLALCVALLPTARASVHKADPKMQELIKLLGQHSAAPRTSSRKLLGGAECLSKITSTSDAFIGSCGGLGVKDESHWCDSDDVTQAAYTSYGVPYAESVYYDTLLALSGDPDSFCIGESADDCCKPNAGAIAGVAIGIVVGLAAIITACAWCCKCCCFRPKLVVQAQPQQAPQVVVVKS